MMKKIIFLFLTMLIIFVEASNNVNQEAINFNQEAINGNNEPNQRVALQENNIINSMDNLDEEDFFSIQSYGLDQVEDINKEAIRSGSLAYRSEEPGSTIPMFSVFAGNSFYDNFFKEAHVYYDKDLNQITNLQDGFIKIYSDSDPNFIVKAGEVIIFDSARALIEKSESKGNDREDIYFVFTERFIRPEDGQILTDQLYQRESINADGEKIIHPWTEFHAYAYDTLEEAQEEIQKFIEKLNNEELQ